MKRELDMKKEQEMKRMRTDDDIVILKHEVKQQDPRTSSTARGSVQSNVQSSYQSYQQYQAPRPVKFTCAKCPGKYDTRSELEEHDKVDHEEKRCEDCEDDFSWPDAEHQCYYTKYQLRSLRGDIVPAF